MADDIVSQFEAYMGIIDVFPLCGKHRANGIGFSIIGNKTVVQSLADRCIYTYRRNIQMEKASGISLVRHHQSFI